MSLHTCPEPDCGRAFLDKLSLADHAEAVHTFDDIRQQVSEAVREKFGSGNAADFPPSPNTPRVYTWVQDIADDWVVFQKETPDDCKLFKSSYAIDGDGNVTLGDPVEVQRQTVYTPVRASS